MYRFRSGFYASLLPLVLGSLACGAPRETSDLGEPSVDHQALLGGFVTSALGVVEFAYRDPSNEFDRGCTGSMIGPNVVLTAAHCFDALGAATQPSGTVIPWVRYFDPVKGTRFVFEGTGTATWTKVPSYDGAGGFPGRADDDMAVFVIPGTFASTDYHDYKRLYADVDGPLQVSTGLTFYGAGHFDTIGESTDDDKLRKHGLTVESVSAVNIVTDNGDGIAVCHGDSGGPIVTSAQSNSGPPASFELVAGVLGLMQASQGQLCANQDGADNAAFARTNARLSWLENTLGRTCPSTGAHANQIYKRCFDVPFVEDLDFEGLTLGVEVALVSLL